MSDTIFKSTDLSPTEILAGDSSEFIIRVVIGPDYTPGPSRIVLDLPGTLGMSRPDLMHTEGNGFFNAVVSNPKVRYTRNVWDMEISDFISAEKRSWRGMAARMAVLDLSEGLEEDDVIELIWGSTEHSYGPGTKATVVVPRPDYRARIHIRYFSSHKRGFPEYGRSYEGIERPKADCEKEVSFLVRPRETSRLRLFRKKDSAVIAPMDVFWNVSECDDIRKFIDADSRGDRTSEGTFLYKDPQVKIRSSVYPLSEAPSMEGAFENYNIYWGDLHTHSTYSIDCIEREKLQARPSDLMRFARERACLDFFAVSDHHQPQDDIRHRIRKQDWEATLEDVSRHTNDGEFLVFPAIEYRCARGDTVAIFNFMPDFKQINRETWQDIRRLWPDLEGSDVLTIPHFHNGGRLGDGEWWEPIESGVEPVLEIYSAHGSYEREEVLEAARPLMKKFRHDRCGLYFLQKGLKYGFVANSDGHKGHVGMSGITGVFAESLEKDKIFEAYRNRRVYASTNAHIRLIFTGNGHLMGSVVPNTARKTFLIDAVGEGPFKKIELFKNGELYHFRPGESRFFKAEIKIDDDEAAFWHTRVTQADNHVAWSSPIWFE
jgi:hypothetical protein